MSSFFRSEGVSLCHIYVQNEMAFDIVSEFGSLGIVSFVDLNSEQHMFQRRFTNEIFRCDAIDSQLHSIINQLSKNNVPILEESHSEFPSPKYRDLHQLEQCVDSLNVELKTLSKNMGTIRESYIHTMEQYSVMKKMDKLLSSIESAQSLIDVEDHTVEQVQINTLTGLIASDKMMPMERILWRFFGRNIYIKVIELEEPIETIKEIGMDDEDQFVYKKVFTIYYKGDNVENKLRKICDAFNTTIIDMPNSSDRAEMMNRLDQQIIDTRTVLSKSKDYYHKVLRNCSTEIFKWRVQVIKFRSIFIELNKFNYDLAQKCLIGELWCPDGNRPTLSNVLQRFNQINDYLAPTILDIIPKRNVKQTVPTFYRLNKFTNGFQQIVDSYGVADYQEINPAPYTIITFPFLFAIMFGDAGHGLIMALFGLWMVLYERPLAARKIRDEIWQMFFGGRYIILLMGMFSIYTGLMYNDFFSKSLNIFGSSFGPVRPGTNSNGDLWYNNATMELRPDRVYTGTPYPFGIDPVWQLSANRILFLNSYKMKLSVILGVTQMAFGTTLSLLNHIHFRRYINIICEFIPQILFLMNIFGYMNIMIFVKWFKYSYENASEAPSILINLINMFLMKYPTDGPIYLQQWFPGQKTLQIFLLLSALICVPWILFPKVFYLQCFKRNRQYEQFVDENQVDEEGDAAGGGESPSSPSSSTNNHGHNESFGDVLIHQAIHTIEYCLGSISHTASYLRLWALSLAHSELSEVLWSMVLRAGISASGSSHYLNGLIMFFAFSMWAVLSVAVLIVMEGLSAFLHALRLHWVEFQSKFYQGAGIKFDSFSFDTLLMENEIH
ncbi:hypothetical protein RDWZM_010113 [Blomia tropicalis]|uniref:V-type proton ATPase subunit a n=1 Tax=Blomia tropicalis TaxID=40697 RepID=A0A9Q0LW61_BLOTA|nr:Unc-32p [Blomia tropicalis]KAJ6215613.1 hypothetical protein RDWZM_010113 [Blomia tropicalis]